MAPLAEARAGWGEYAVWLSRPTLRVECPSCDGFGDHGCDEEGKRMSCFGCGEVGYIEVPNPSVMN